MSTLHISEASMLRQYAKIYFALSINQSVSITPNKTTVVY